MGPTHDRFHPKKTVYSRPGMYTACGGGGRGGGGAATGCRQPAKAKREQRAKARFIGFLR
jgi:hypothetical protein